MGPQGPQGPQGPAGGAANTYDAIGMCVMVRYRMGAWVTVGPNVDFAGDIQVEMGTPSNCSYGGEVLSGTWRWLGKSSVYGTGELPATAVGPAIRVA
jgi:hypothetical protein